MHTHRHDEWRHEHVFGQDRVRLGERRALLVTVLTAVTMVVEIAAGLAFGSMALLADGLHMTTHTVALGIAVVAYMYTRRYAADPRYTFGTGKVNVLAGFTSAVILALFAAGMAFESVHRVISPVTIQFAPAIVVALIGLAVNGASVLILAAPNQDHRHAHDHQHGHQHGHAHGGSDHNLRGAYLHVLADCLTSVLAIGALVMAKTVGWIWLDPAVGIVGAVLIACWAWGLMRETAQVLLDRQAPERVSDAVRDAIEASGEDHVTDLHVWSIGPDVYSASVALVSHDPKPPAHYKGLIPDDARVVHATLEVHRCDDGDGAAC
jgi:cation diffusion facilitator family transporter